MHKVGTSRKQLALTQRNGGGERGKDHNVITGDSARVIDSGVNPSIGGHHQSVAQVADQIVLKPHQVEAVHKLGIWGLGCRLIGDDMRCVSGNTIINVNRAGKGFSVPIHIAYQSIRHGWWDPNIPTKTRSLVDGEIRLQEIAQIHRTGTKWLLKIKTEGGKQLELTKDHLVATAKGWVAAGGLSVGDEVLTNGHPVDGCSQCGSTQGVIKYKYAKFVGWCKQCMYRHGRDNDSRGLGGRSIGPDGYVRVSGQYDHPRAQNSGYQVKEHELVMEKHLGRYLLWPDEQVHHKDHNKQNNDISNLELLSRSEHGKRHGDYSHFPMAKPKKDRIVSIEPAGIWPVYDITMAGEYHNFVADGIIVHNCGKTPTAIAIDQSLRTQVERRVSGNNGTLIVCPKSVLMDWVDHLSRMGVARSAVTVVDLPSKEKLRKALAEIKDSKRLKNAPARYVVINWDSVQTIERELKSAGPWFHIIGDEIHRIKGRDTKRTNSFKRIKAKQLTGLSGTPADNRPEDFWSVLNWLRPREFSSYWDFVDKYCDVFVLKSGYKKIKGVNHDTLPELREKIAPYYIRRKLVDVADHVPAKQYRTIYVEMGKRQRREYDALVADDMSEIEGGLVLTTLAITKLTRRQQLAIGVCEGNWIKRRVRNEDTGKMILEDYFDVHITDSPRSPKLDAVMDYMKEEEDAGPFIIFAQHQDTVRLLRLRLEHNSWSVASIVGTDSAEDRRQAVSEFQSGRKDVFVGTIGACREGITLSRSQTIIFTDRAWNPNWNRQAEARADALDSHLPVTIVNIEASDSVDQYRNQKIRDKGEWTDAIIGTS